jgi:hypothetical protein
VRCCTAAGAACAPSIITSPTPAAGLLIAIVLPLFPLHFPFLLLPFDFLSLLRISLATYTLYSLLSQPPPSQRNLISLDWSYSPPPSSRNHLVVLPSLFTSPTRAFHLARLSFLPSLWFPLRLIRAPPHHSPSDPSGGGTAITLSSPASLLHFGPLAVAPGFPRPATYPSPVSSLPPCASPWCLVRTSVSLLRLNPHTRVLCHHSAA